MASGKIHRQDSTALAVIGGGALWAGDQPPLTVAAFALGALTGIVLSPDLDVDHKTESELIVYKLGLLPGALFYFYWLPYALFIPHRHPLSHWPALGTLGRLLYLLPIFAIVWTLTGELLLPLALPFVWGLMGSDALHWLRDKMK